MKMKRILVKVKPYNGERFSMATDQSVAPLLIDGCSCDFWSCGSSELYLGDAIVASGSCESVSNSRYEMPAKFVLELPAYLVREGVPAYTGPIKGGV